MFKFIKKNKLLYVFTLGFIVMYSLMDIAKSLLMSKMFDNATLFTSLHAGILLILVFLLVYLIVMDIQKFMVEVLKNKVRFNLNRELYNTYLTMYPNKFKTIDSSDVINGLNNEVNIIVENYISSKLNIFFLVVSFLFGSLYIGSISLYILGLLYICGICSFCLNLTFSGKLKKNQDQLNAAQKDWIKTIKNFHNNFKSIKNDALVDPYKNSLDTENKKFTKKLINANGFMKSVSVLNEGIAQIMFFGTMLLGIFLINNDLMTIGALMGVIQASNMVINPISNYMNLKNNVSSSLNILNQYFEKTAYVQKDGTIELKEALNAIKVQNLTYRYGDHVVLENINIEFKRNKKYLIIGESGSGKSTLLELITKQENGDAIFANEVPLEDISFTSYIKHISYISQKNYLLPADLENNITLGKPICDSEFDEILEEVNLLKLKAKKKKKFRDDAPELSGGEIQRIHLARAIFAQKEWIVLDEAFASLDEKNAKDIEEKLLKKETLSFISVSHKIYPELVKLYDYVIEIKDKKALVYPQEVVAKEKVV